MKAIIGITGNTTLMSTSSDPEPFWINYSPRSLSKAISEAGGLPLIIPINELGPAEEYINIIDGLLISGGQDISPFLYGEEPRNVIGPTSPKRDLVEQDLLKEAVRQGKAVLGVCRGMQLINVVFGGNLLQDLSENPEITLQHVQKTRPNYSTHTVHVNQDSHLSNIIADKSRVNSFHHQAINQLAPGLKVSARSSDNVIEAIELMDQDHSIVGIQWHPELTYYKDEMAMDIFKDIVRRAESVKKAKA